VGATDDAIKMPGRQVRILKVYPKHRPRVVPLKGPGHNGSVAPARKEDVGIRRPQRESVRGEQAHRPVDPVGGKPTP
jgi:hypothetical protein